MRPSQSGIMPQPPIAKAPAGGANWFVALAVPAGDWWRKIPPPPHGVRLFDASDLHVTVAFLGPVGAAAAEAAFEIAPRWPTASLEVTLGAVVPMGNPRRPSALSAMVDDGADRLSGAIGEVRSAMWERAGAKPDDRPPLPHVTIARLARSAAKTERKAAVAWAAGLELGRPRVTLSRLVLFTHAEDRSVRLFREHAEHSFGGGGG